MGNKGGKGTAVKGELLTHDDLQATNEAIMQVGDLIAQMEKKEALMVQNIKELEDQIKKLLIAQKAAGLFFITFTLFLTRKCLKFNKKSQRPQHWSKASSQCPRTLKHCDKK